MRILYITNKCLPDGDHRLVYAKISRSCEITFAFPSKPQSLDESHFVRFGFSEGFRLVYCCYFLQLWAYLRSNRACYDLVHFNSTNLILLGPIIAWLAGIPSIITVTGFGRTFFRDSPKFRMLQWLYLSVLGVSVSCARRVLFQNHGHLEWMRSRSPYLRSKLKYVGSAVSAPVVGEKDFSVSPLRVLLVARLMPDKGIDDFLHVAEDMRCGPWKFILVGPRSAGFSDLAARVEASHSRGIIEYMGELDAASVTHQFALAHVFFFPSHHEGMARVMLECGFARMCPVAYNIPANRDLSGEGRGFLVAVGHTEQVISTLTELSRNRAVLLDNAVAYQKHVLENFDVESFRRRMDAILQELGTEMRP
jgi:glycosyltransferase involved in cell wall biosynthesis